MSATVNVNGRMFDQEHAVMILTTDVPVYALGNKVPQIHPEAENNLIFDWDLGNADETAAHTSPLVVFSHGAFGASIATRCNLWHSA